jgi:phosphoserine phosphatase
MKLICFDCDSTLSGIEGIDELGRLRGPAQFAEVERMTNDAMNGKIPLESVFGGRLEVIRPTRADVAEIGRAYLEAIEPTAEHTVRALRSRGWTPAIVSAGFTDAIGPLAEHLGIEIIRAVDLRYTAEGAYAGFDQSFPATRSGGKPVVVRELKQRYAPEKIVTIGDGVSDLETKPEVDLFVGFGRYVVRSRVEKEADRFIRSLDELVALIG